MTVQQPPSFSQNVSTESATQARQLISAMFPSAGVVGPDDLAVTQNATPNMSVNVAAGAAILPGTQATLQGDYHGYQDASVNLAIAAANASNPRIDIVCAGVNDGQYSGSTTTLAANTWGCFVITGVAAPSPVAPATPTSSVVLAQVLVPASATSIVTADITDERPKARALVAQIPHTSVATLVPSSQQFTVGTGSYQNYPGAGGGPLSVAFAKYRDDTTLLARIDISRAWNSAAGGWLMGVNINSTDYTLSGKNTQANVEATVTGEYPITGLSAGIYTATLRAYAAAGAVYCDGETRMSIHVTETM